MATCFLFDLDIKLIKKYSKGNQTNDNTKFSIGKNNVEIIVAIVLKIDGVTTKEIITGIK